MYRFSHRTLVLLLVLVCALLPSTATAQTRTTGQIVGTVRDVSGAVVPGAEIVLIDSGTGTTVESKSGPDGSFVLPNLQAGRYQLTATAQGFQPVTIQEVIVQTARATDVTVQFELAGVTEQIMVTGRSQVVETTASTISTTVSNEQIAKLPLSGRNILDFALLTPGTAQSSTGRFSTFNGLPGGAINITLDGINNNSQRFRSGGTSFFVFAPVRLGAMEEVTVSTAGLTADAGAEGAVQVQFVTKRGTNSYRGQVFDQIRNDSLNANSWLNNARQLPKAELRQHEWGGNIGGPIIRNKLFFFANYEQINAPSQSTQTRQVLTSEAQQGIFRYTATDNSVRTVNLLDIARANNLPGTVDPLIASQLATISGTLSQGALRPIDLMRQELSFQIPVDPQNVYPTGRVDWQVNDSLAIRGVLNLQWRDLARNPQFPSLDFVNGGFTSTYYILSTGADWTIRPNLFNQFSFGFQSNYEEFNPGNDVDDYGGVQRIGYPALGTPALTTLNPTGDIMPQPRNNPVYNLSNTVTWLKGPHTLTLGGTFRRTSMWEKFGAVARSGPRFDLATVATDPATNAFSATTIPGVRNEDLANARNLYALLAGRISNITSTNNVNPDTLEYEADWRTAREAQTVGGLYAQDSWRVNPRFTLNYGLRWEFTGAAHNTNGIYTSPDIDNFYGPSRELFQPGVLDGVLDPQIEQRSNPYKADLVNPAPNVGFAWNPSYTSGFLGRFLGDGRSVIRGSVGMNYYDEGLIAFQQHSGNNPGLQQTVSLVPGQPGFPPGGLSLSSPVPPLSVFPSSFSFPLPMSLFTFSRGMTTIDPEIRTPYVANWTIGLQRELGPNVAVEARYVGNKGFNLWRSYNINEVNIFENGFLDQFRQAQRNLAVNRANGLAGFGNNNLPGQAATPIFDAAFGPRGSQAAVTAAQGYSNTNFITLLDQGQAGGLANSLAGTNTYLCRMLGSTFGPCANLGFNAAGPYPINVFQANPFAAGQAQQLLTDDGWSRYNGLQLQIRRRYVAGFSIAANYTYSKARSNRYSDSPSAATVLMTNRDDDLNEAPHIFDLRHAFQTYWTYDLPFGSGRRYEIGNPVLNQIAGGWTVSGIYRLQSGRPFFLQSGRNTFNQFDSGVVLNGITVKELQKMIKLSPGSNATMLFVDPRLIGPDGRANPEFLLSPTTAGELGQRVFLYGPSFWNLDVGLAKRFNAPGGVYFNFEALFLDVFNHTAFLVGGTSSDSGFGVNINNTNFGQTTNTASGPRNIQLRLVLGF